jgi:hypothetical protein
MSTNGIIARSTGEGTFAGRYHHWDSYPSGLGVALVELYRGHFKRDLDRMLRFLLDEHTGWSTIVSCDFKLKPGYTNVARRPEGMSYDEFSQLPINRRPQCFCHGHRKEEGFVADHTTDCGASWAYVFDEENKTLHVLDREKNEDGSGYHWQEVGRIALDSKDKINWDVIECGENFERCGHYAWHHGLAPKTCNLSTQTFLGKRPLDPIHDSVGYIIAGKKYKATGCGGTSDYMRGSHPRGTWVASLITGNNRRVDLPIARHTETGYELLSNVAAIYPPTAKAVRA